MKFVQNSIVYIYKHAIYQLSFLLLSLCFALPVAAQNCPSNIDFEKGTFDGWACYTGNVYVAPNGQNTMDLSPIAGPAGNRHVMYSAFPGGGLDGYGGFPVNCPNGSGHSVRLGNDQVGAQAEGLYYIFTIPAGQDKYTLIYHYAVVFENPGHDPAEQPRMVIEVANLTDNKVIDCSSVTFVSSGSSLPGFKRSPNRPAESEVWYKEWTAVSINLNGLAGKAIRIFARTADCTVGGHFGYGYLDFNTECDGTLPGASYCPGDTIVSVIAPYGYHEYLWWNSTFSQIIGSQQILTFKPPPAIGTQVAVIVKPYDGYGCVDTFYAELRDNRIIIPEPGSNQVTCNGVPVQIGSPPKTGVTYHWEPSTGLSDPDIASPYANPATTTVYTLHTASTSGGCRDEAQVTVLASKLDNSIELVGKEAFCLNTGDKALLKVHPTYKAQWYKDYVAIAGATQFEYNVLETGLYYAILENLDGCKVITPEKKITVTTVPKPGFDVAVKEQCLVGNKFIFTNTSTNQIGDMEFRWKFGDGVEVTTTNAAHTYSKAGVYHVKLIASSNTICIDSISTDIIIHPNAIPEFDAATICVGLPLQLVNKTADTVNSVISYLWDFGNGQLSNNRTPPVLTYSTPGIYPVTLSVSTAQCPLPLISKRQYILVDTPKRGIAYPVQVAVENLPLELHARQFDGSLLWSPAVSLNNSAITNPVFRGTSDKLYRIEITSRSGCVTIDTQVVKVVKKIDVYVPTAFTPNSDGLNDKLYPIMYGIKTLIHFRVFNRWGQLVFQTNVYKEGWDGKFKSMKQEPQTYVWDFEGIGADGKTYTKQGTTILIR